MCPMGIWIRVLGWGGSVSLRSTMGYFPRRVRSTRTAKKGILAYVDEASAWRIAFLISPGSCSGFGMHDLASR